MDHFKRELKKSERDTNQQKKTGKRIKLHQTFFESNFFSAFEKKTKQTNIFISFANTQPPINHLPMQKMPKTTKKSKKLSLLWDGYGKHYQSHHRHRRRRRRLRRQHHQDQNDENRNVPEEN